MARFSLRNQHIIKEKLGEDFLKWLLSSLKETFKKGNVEELEYPSEKFKVIISNNIQPNTDSFFELYVISKHFDVYNLAYKSCVG